MSIGANIKKLRHERVMTQEQLAELLGVTAKAVSQWECDRTAPDISQIPSLAHIFRVSADVILGIDITATDAKVEKVYNQVRELWCTGRRSEAEALCREGLKEFPDAYILTEELAWYLSYSTQPERLEESIALYERLLTTPLAMQDTNKNFYMGTLCQLYIQTGKPEKATEIAESISERIFSKDDCIEMTLQGANKAEHIRRQVNTKFVCMINDLQRLLCCFPNEHPLFSTDELLSLWQKVIDLTAIYYEDGDYAFADQELFTAHYRRARLLLVQEKNEAALTELEAMQKSIQRYDAYAEGLFGDLVVIPREKWRTSLLVRPRDENDPSVNVTVSVNSTENAAMDYFRRLQTAAFDPIRANPRFVAVENALKAAAHD